MTVMLWCVAAVAGAALLIGALLTRRPVRALGGGALSGLCALAAVNVAAIWSGVSLGITAFSTGVAAALGIPGVITLLVMQALCAMPL